MQSKLPPIQLQSNQHQKGHAIHGRSQSYAGTSNPKIIQTNNNLHKDDTGSYGKTSNFTVAVRVKPNIEGLDEVGSVNFYESCPDTLIVQIPNLYPNGYANNKKNRKFNFDHLFVDKNNQNIYDTLIKPHLGIIDHNQNLNIFTYGITGSGKTHTIFGKTTHGSLSQLGIASMCIRDLMKINNEIDFALSYMQIYNEQVNDLLAYEGEDNLGKLKQLNVLQDGFGKVKIPQLSVIPIVDVHDVAKLIEKGNSLRVSSNNSINKFSSRSHALLQLHCHNRKSGISNTVTIIDLAGSQKHITQSRPENRDKSKQKEYLNLQKQGSNINKSLLALGNCLKSLENGQAHVPYRDSKLTRILKDDLSGKAHNIMIACVGRNLTQSQETMNTLQYAARAMRIKVQKKINNKSSESFQCRHCYRSTSWKDIIQLIPNEIKNSDKTNLKPSHTSQVDSKQLSINIKKWFQDFKNQLKDMINQSLKKSYDLRKKQQEDYGYITEKENAELNLDGIFEEYEQRLLGGSEPINQPPQSQKRIYRENNQVVYPSPVVKGADKQNIFFNKNATEYVDKTENIKEPQWSIENPKISNLSLYQPQKQNTKKRLTVRNIKEVLSATTADLSNNILSPIISKNAHNNSELINVSKIKTQRMNPDLQFSQFGQSIVGTNTNKNIIIKKLEQAKKKCIDYTHQNCCYFELQGEGDSNNEFMPVVWTGENRQKQVFVSSFMMDDQLDYCL